MSVDEEVLWLKSNKTDLSLWNQPLFFPFGKGLIFFRFIIHTFPASEENKEMNFSIFSSSENVSYVNFEPDDFANYDLNLPTFDSDIHIPFDDTIPTGSLARVQPPIKCNPVPGMDFTITLHQ